MDPDPNPGGPKITWIRWIVRIRNTEWIRGGQLMKLHTYALRERDGFIEAPEGGDRCACWIGAVAQGRHGT